MIEAERTDLRTETKAGRRTKEKREEEKGGRKREGSRGERERREREMEQKDRDTANVYKKRHFQSNKLLQDGLGRQISAAI